MNTKISVSSHKLQNRKIKTNYTKTRTKTNPKPLVIKMKLYSISTDHDWNNTENNTRRLVGELFFTPLFFCSHRMMPALHSHYYRVTLVYIWPKVGINTWLHMNPLCRMYWEGDKGKKDELGALQSTDSVGHLDPFSWKWNITGAMQVAEKVV